MTRQEAIAAITERLANAPDEIVQSVAKLLDAASSEESVLPRPLTARELALIEQSKADFRDGRTYSPEESRAYVEAGLAERRAIRNKA
jgi:hypothetical protein